MQNSAQNFLKPVVKIKASIHEANHTIQTNTTHHRPCQTLDVSHPVHYHHQASRQTGKML